MEPVVQVLTEEYQKEIVFLIIDVQKQDDPTLQKLVERFQVQYIPTIVLINAQGQVVQEHVGAVAEEELREKIKEILK